MSDNVHESIMRIIYNSSRRPTPSPSEVDILNSLPMRDVIVILQDIFWRESDSMIKGKAFNSILSIHNYDQVQFLLDAFNRLPTDWQLACCSELSRFHDSRAIVKLCNILLEDPDPDLRFSAAEGLAEIGDTSALGALKHAAQYDRGSDYEGFPITEVAGEAIKRIEERIH